jgi:hypothetical protein
MSEPMTKELAQKLLQEQRGADALAERPILEKEIKHLHEETTVLKEKVEVVVEDLKEQQVITEDLQGQIDQIKSGESAPL